MKFLLFILLSISINSFAQTDSLDAITDIRKFQDELNHEFKDQQKSPLEEKQFKKFKGHKFYPINLDYRIQAKFLKAEKDSTFKMKTTSDRRPVYTKYADAVFEIEGVSYKVQLYQDTQSKNENGNKELLFLPFKDLANGQQTYEGGRFIDIEVPEGDQIIIDFNKAYNPFCAYSHNYSCPIPPKQNHLKVKIPAGVMLKK